MLGFLKIYAKTVGAFVFGVVANMVLGLINDGTPWPQTKDEWVQYIVTSFGAAIGAWALRNKVTEKTVQTGITKGDVTPQAVTTIAINTPAPPLSPSADAGNLVDQVIRDAQRRSE